jgi:ABC-type multidrug transport system fused ATPase/permease subunit
MLRPLPKKQLRRRVQEGPAERKMEVRALASRLLSYALPYRKELIVALCAVIITSITQAAGPYILGQEIVAKYIFRSDFFGLQIIVLAAIGVLVANWVAAALRIYMIGKLGESMLFKMRFDLFSHLQELSFSFFDRSNSGDIISTVTNDTENIGEAFASGAIQVTSDILSLALIVILMFIINIQLALVSLLIIPIIIVSTLAFQSRFTSAYRTTREKISSLTSKLQESISGVKEIKSFSKENDVIEDFKEVNVRDFKANLQATKVWGAFQPTMQVIQAIGIVIVILYGGLLAFNGELGSVEEAVGTLITFLMYIGMFFGPILDLTNLYNMIQSTLAAAERIFGLIDTSPDIIDKDDAAEMPMRVEGEISFKNVSFGYDPKIPVLEDISFHVKSNETIALVGPTGAGKSTIIKLLGRFYEPQSGSIKIDGQDIRHFTQRSLHEGMGIVLQTTTLFAGTIMDNIKYGKLEATDMESENAAKTVGAHEFITNMPDGYDTKIGEGGAGLSVGQKQLISFARVLLRSPAILILDEATSSIDPHTDLLIRRATNILLKNRTSIIIAHRFSTVRNADRILVIDKGRIAEEGSHKELMEKGGLYCRLYEMQFKEPDEANH